MRSAAWLQARPGRSVGTVWSRLRRRDTESSDAVVGGVADGNTAAAEASATIGSRLRR